MDFLDILAAPEIFVCMDEPGCMEKQDEHYVYGYCLGLVETTMGLLGWH